MSGFLIIPPFSLPIVNSPAGTKTSTIPSWGEIKVLSTSSEVLVAATEGMGVLVGRESEGVSDGVVDVGSTVFVKLLAEVASSVGSTCCVTTPGGEQATAKNKIIREKTNDSCDGIVFTLLLIYCGPTST